MLDDLDHNDLDHIYVLSTKKFPYPPAGREPLMEKGLATWCAVPAVTG